MAVEEKSEARQDAEFHSPDGRGPRAEPVKPAAQARQGIASGRMLMILTLGIILVVVGFAVSYMGAV